MSKVSTGFENKWGDRLYVGDVINTKPARYVVVEHKGEFKLKVIFTGMQGFGSYREMSSATDGIRIGNAEDNPELLDNIYDQFFKDKE